MAKYIVLLDDDPDEQFILQDAFRMIGTPVIIRQFVTPANLIVHLKELKVLPEVLFIDVNLPGYTGLVCLKELHQQFDLSKTLTVIYTNAADEGTISEAFACGASVYMKKHSTFDKLTQHLKQLLQWNAYTIANLPIRGRTFRS